MIFPPRLTPGLRDLRDSAWAQIVDRVAMLDTADSERIAFELLVVRWSGCVNCQADSFRAMQGCALCAAQAIRRYRGNNSDLQRLFTEAAQEIEAFIDQAA